MTAPDPPYCPDCQDQMNLEGETNSSYRYHCPEDDNYQHVQK